MGFKEFLFRGNLIQLAVAIVIGEAFGKLINAFTSGLITPILGIFGGTPSFSDLSFAINGSRFLYGVFIDAIIAFLITAVTLYYCVVVPSDFVLAKIMDDDDLLLRPCPQCVSKINKDAIRCPHCTSYVAPPSEEEIIKPDSSSSGGGGKPETNLEVEMPI